MYTSLVCDLGFNYHSLYRYCRNIIMYVGGANNFNFNLSLGLVRLYGATRVGNFFSFERLD